MKGEHKRKNRVIWGWLGSLKTIGNVIFPYSYRAHTNMGELGFHITQRRLGQSLPPYQVSSWSIQPFGTTVAYRHGPKIWMRCCAPFWGELSPHLTQCVWGRGLPLCQVSSWSIQPFGHNTRTSQTDRTDIHGQRSIGETVLQMVAPKSARLVY